MKLNTMTYDLDDFLTIADVGFVSGDPVRRTTTG